jgi:hypothetical protein
MTSDRALERLEAYKQELEAIQSRFRHTRDGVHIGDGDDGRLHQIVLELRDLFNDLLGKNTYSSMVVAAYSEGISNFFNSPSFNSAERIKGVVSAAITRIRENPSVLATPDEQRVPLPIEPPPPLKLPERVTLRWLYEHVPYSLWAWFSGLLLAAFALGITSAIKLSVVQQWFGILCSNVG